MVGESLAHYRILEKIGSGGMGEVYLAEDTKLDRRVALKVLPPELADDGDRRSRFEREAKALAALNHPGIVHVYSVEEAGGVHFITMEHVTGKTLSSALPKRGFSLRAFLDLALPLVDAVSAAHQSGIAHRDLKPDNIIVGDDGKVKVLDFGLARPAARVGAAGSDSDLPTEQMTREGRILGTVAYMSPEQAEGKRVDARSDIFSLGVTFYEMLTGERPFGGDTPASTLSAVIKDAPRPVNALVPSLPRDVARIVKRCLAKDPSRRYQTTIDVRNELEELARSLDSGELVADEFSSRASSSSRRWLLGSAVAVVGLLAALWATGVVRTPLEGPNLPAVPRFENARPITSATGPEDTPTWSPDGLTLAYDSSTIRSSVIDGNVLVQQIDGGPPVNRTEGLDGGCGLPSWSPDGRNIAFLCNQRDESAYYVMSAHGGDSRKVMSTFSTTLLKSPPQWLGGGAELAGMSEDGETLEIVELDSRRTRELALPVAARNTAEWRWSPDERLVAYVEAVSRGAQLSRIWMMRVTDGASFPITEDGNNWNPMWSQTGDTLFYISNRGGAMDLWAQRIDDEQGTVGAAVPVTVGIGMRSASFSRDFTKLAYSKGRPVVNAWRIPIPVLRDRLATWADAEAITSEEAYIEYLDISPDGTELALNSDRAGNLDLWIVPLGGGEWRQLTTRVMPDWAPRYSTDGSEIVFHSHHDGSRDLFTVPSDGGVIRALTESPEFELQATFSPDGRRVAYWNRGARALWVLSRDDGSAERLTEAPGGVLPEWSPDGRHILFTEPRSLGVGAVWKASDGGEQPERLADSTGWIARWSLDGRSIYFIRDDNLWTVSTEDGSERQLTDLVGKMGVMGPLGLATDGRHLYFTWRLDTGDIWVMDVVQE